MRNTESYPRARNLPVVLGMSFVAGLLVLAFVLILTGGHAPTRARSARETTASIVAAVAVSTDAPPVTAPAAASADGATYILKWVLPYGSTPDFIAGVATAIWNQPIGNCGNGIIETDVEAYSTPFDKIVVDQLALSYTLPNLGVREVTLISSTYDPQPLCPTSNAGVVATVLSCQGVTNKLLLPAINGATWIINGVAIGNGTGYPENVYSWPGGDYSNPLGPNGADVDYTISLAQSDPDNGFDVHPVSFDYHPVSTVDCHTTLNAPTARFPRPTAMPAP
jgi:hypothetical protein